MQGVDLNSKCMILIISFAVDCWDGPDGEPIVHHGYTLTSKILFKDVIETINKYAFIKSEYVFQWISIFQELNNEGEEEKEETSPQGE